MTMMWLYNMPTWLLGILVVGGTAALVIGGFLLMHRLFTGERTTDGGNLALSFISIVCAFHSLLVAFSAVLVWQDFQDSASAVAIEANRAGDVYRDLGIYGGPEATRAAQTTIEYVRTVVNEEWPLMASGGDSDKARQLINDVFQQVGRLDPKTPREQVVFGEIFRHINELMNERNERLQDAQSAMPGLFWVIMLIATAILVGYTGMLPLTRANCAMVAGIAASIGLIFLFIIALDHPFAGPAGVDAGPLTEFLARSERPAALR